MKKNAVINTTNDDMHVCLPASSFLVSCELDLYTVVGSEREKNKNRDTLFSSGFDYIYLYEKLFACVK